MPDLGHALRDDAATQPLQGGGGAIRSFLEPPATYLEAARDAGFADETRQIVVMAGVPFNVPGTTNILRIAPCDERLIYSTDPE